MCSRLGWRVQQAGAVSSARSHTDKQVGRWAGRQAGRQTGRQAGRDVGRLGSMNPEAWPGPRSLE